MIVIKQVSEFQQLHGACVATVGKFDGVHRGHRAILGRLKEVAGELGLPAVVVLLEPHPEEFFAGDDGECPARLSSVQEKLHLMEGIAVDFAFVLRFDEALSRLSAEAYIKNILVDGLGLRHLVIGDDFRFGHRRQGDMALLQQRGTELGFTVETAPTYEQHGQRVSSSRVRELLEAGDFAAAEAALGRPYAICGEVVRGQRLGTDLGFPTCNIPLHRRRIPLHGIYACQVRVDGGLLPAAVSIGYRPTLGPGGEALLEAYLLDFDGNLYGQSIEVLFRKKIRDEVKFADLDAMKAQMAKDVTAVRAALSEI